MWWKLLSLVRRLTFICFVVLLVSNVYFGIDVIEYFIQSIFAYIVVLIISIISFGFEYKKYPNMKNSFITRIFREDFCDPIIEHSRNYYRVGERLGALWEHRNRRDRTFLEKVKSFFVRIFVYMLIVILGIAIIYAIYNLR